ncbi:hypothetical protein Naga_100606g1 [Nannochloropsis gaditana]|uniref:Uncharacterized protein n=1 Tax=Nannochloropsis gaditana TaxID=72520 RepID=W7TJL9_9STRA|nr:hypothetical protein Naga_100606g1 [Nannochloropsis gaditana]
MDSPPLLLLLPFHVATYPPPPPPPPPIRSLGAGAPPCPFPGRSGSLPKVAGTACLQGKPPPLRGARPLPSFLPPSLPPSFLHFPSMLPCPPLRILGEIRGVCLLSGTLPSPPWTGRLRRSRVG